MQANMKALEILDKKTADAANADRDLKGRQLDASRMNVTTDAKTPTGSVIKSTTRQFQSDDGMMVK